jgi:hypothetical protein
MSEPTIGIPVGAQRVEDWSAGCVVEKDGEAVAIQQTPVGEDELLGGMKVDWHPANLRRAEDGVLQKSDRRRARETAHLIAHVRL